MVFIFFGFCLAVHLLALSWLAPLMWKFKDSFNYNSELFWLIALPVLIVIHAILPGLICKSSLTPIPCPPAQYTPTCTCTYALHVHSVC